MNLTRLQETLLNAARRQPPGDHVPYAFEKRIMARLAAAPVDCITIWARALWRAAFPCATIAMALGVWTLVSVQTGGSFDNLDVEFEQTVFAGMNYHLEDAW